jgi:hypothetical protein
MGILKINTNVFLILEDVDIAGAIGAEIVELV